MFGPAAILSDMCTVEIRPGRGGADAEQFAEAIAATVRAWAARNSRPSGIASATARTIAVALPRTPASALT